jgi:O-antigen/teichoic acid export membrane protein
MNGNDGNLVPDFVRRACSLGGTQAVALLSTFLIHMLAARTLSASDYGSFALCWLLSAGCQVLLVGGIPYALRRAVSVDPSTRRLIRRYVLLGQFPISLAVALALVAGARELAGFLGEPELEIALALVGGEILFHTGLVDPCLQILNGARADRIYTALAVGYHLARLALTASFLQAPGGLTGGMLGLTLAAGLGAVLALPTLWLFPASGRSSRRARQALGVAAWMKTGYAHELFSFLTGAVNLWLVQLCVDERQFVGVYSACTMLSRAALALAAILVGASFAPLACAFHDGNRHQARVTGSGSLRPLAVSSVQATPGGPPWPSALSERKPRSGLSSWGKPCSWPGSWGGPPTRPAAGGCGGGSHSLLCARASGRRAWSWAGRATS